MVFVVILGVINLCNNANCVWFDDINEDQPCELENMCIYSLFLDPYIVDSESANEVFDG